MSDVLIQIVDENDQPIGAATIEEAHQKGLFHRASRIIVEDEKGRLLLQKRAMNKGLYPGRWDPSVAGHVDEGEDYEAAAKREAEEEIGLKNIRLTEIGYYKFSGQFEWRKLNRFAKVYKSVIGSATVLTIDSDEVEKVEWFTLPEVKRLVTEHPDQVSDGLRDAILRYYP